MAIRVYGADWCSMTAGTRKHLDDLEIPYQYINVDDDQEAARWVREQNDGRERKPTLDINGAVIAEPSNADLDSVLRKQHVMD
jgi:glutaredoxin